MFGRRVQPKEEHPASLYAGLQIYATCEKCQSIYELEAGHTCIFPLGRSGLINPPRGGSVIAPPQDGDATLPVSPYTGEPYDPAWGSTWPGGQSNRALIALMKAIEREIVPPSGPGGIVPSPRVDSRLIGEEQR